MKLFILLFCMFVGHCEAFKNLANMASSMNPMNMMFSNKCMGDLGCFNTGPPFFDPIRRPLSVAPVDNPKPKFMLYTKTNPSKPYLLEATPRSLQNSPFDSRAEVKMFIHGFKFKLNPKDAHFKAKDDLLKQDSYNVIIADWTDYNGMPYHQAVANSRVIGAVIAKLIKFLIDQTGILARLFHLIGHSLGCHVAGYAGERIPGLGRITGLDCAGPFFQGTDPKVRLDPNDAIFVDAIHTNGANSMMSGLGMTEPVGHMDFYPNGGSKQPGCANATGDEAPPKNDPTAIFGKHKCDHMRSTRHFQESVNPHNTFRSVHCNTYAEFQSGKNRSSIYSPMGLHARKIPGLGIGAKFCLKTSATPPYSLR